MKMHRFIKMDINQIKKKQLKFMTEYGVLNDVYFITINSDLCTVT